MDENTVVFACGLSDEHGNQDFTCAQLWVNIAKNCHQIAVNDLLVDAYYRLASRPQNPGFKLIRVIKHLMANSNKHQFLRYSPPYDWVSGLPADDAHLVVLAIQSNAVLVTSDSRLREKIAELEIAQIRSLRVLAPADAVPLTLAL